MEERAFLAAFLRLRGVGVYFSTRSISSSLLSKPFVAVILGTSSPALILNLFEGSKEL